MKALKIGELTARIPVIQGGMGVGISLSGLAGSVAACGGVGVISTAQIGYRDPEFEKDPIKTNLRVIGEEIQKAREIAKGGILGVNIMVATKQYAEYVKAAVKAGIDLIISGAGLPMELPKLVAGSKTKIAPIVSTVKAARVICRFWDHHYQRMPDLVVIEGPKAGGHLGFSRKQLEEFTPVTYDQEIRGILAEVKKYADKYGKEIPVVVAGGIFTREDMLHAMELGADGVQMGTRFVVAKESIVHENYKERIVKARDIDSEVTGMSTGHPIRVLRNAMSREYLKLEKEGAGFEELEQLTLGSLRKAVMDGDVVHGSLMAGQCAGLVKKEQTCQEMIEELMAQTAVLLGDGDFWKKKSVFLGRTSDKGE